MSGGGVSGFSANPGPRVHYQKPRSVNEIQGGFKWNHRGQGRGAGPEEDEDEMPPLKAPAPASVPSPARSEVKPESRASLVEGCQVRIDGLTGAKHLNGSSGILVGKEEGRLLVELSSGPGAGTIKALKPENVEPDVASRTSAATQSSASRPSSAPNPQRSAARPTIEVGTRVRLGGLETRPELNDACGVVVAIQGSRYHIRLDSGGDKLMKAKNLTRLPGSAVPYTPVKAPAPAPAAATAPAKVPAKAPTPAPAPVPAAAQPRPRPAPAPAMPIRPPPKLRDLLQAAKPSWTEKDLNNVIDKLSKAQVSSFEHLRDALRSTGAASLNERLRTAGQKVFATDTIMALKTRVDLEEPPKPQIEQNPQNLPVQRWEVVHDLAMVREKPSLAARALARKDRGEVVQSTEETFDGFLKLHGEEGYCAKDCQGKLGLGTLLRRMPGQSDPVLAADMTAPGPGPQPFKVVFSPSVAVRAAPSTDANIISARKTGEVILAESQTYSGWLRLDGDAGWMLSRHPQHGVLLQPAFDKARPQQETPSEDFPSMDQVVQETMERRRAPQATPSDNRRPPVAQPDRSADAERQKAEQRRAAEAQRAREQEDERRRQEEERRRKQAEEEQRRKKEEAKRIQEEQERRRQREEDARRAKEAEEAKVAAVQLAAEQERLLDAFAEAAASGDPARIKTARDAAKKGGVPTKEIARVFALAQQAAE